MEPKDRADSALQAIPTPSDRDEWLKISMAYKAADGDFDTWDMWCQRGDGYNARENQATWRSIKSGGGVTEATLFKIAQEHGWQPASDRKVFASSIRKSSQPKKSEDDIVEHYEEKLERNPSTEDEDIEKARERLTAAIANGEKALPYLKTRGITPETAKRFNIGWYEKFKPYHLLIPYPDVDQPYYVVRRVDVAPNGHVRGHWGKYRYPTGLKKQLFNIPALTASDTVFVTEGQIDAITLEQHGVSAVSSNEPAQLIEAVKAKAVSPQFFIVPDNDETGEKKAQKMQEALTAAGLKAYIYSIPPAYHDVNDFHLQAAADLYEWTRGAAAVASEEERAALEEYRKITGAARLPGLQTYIKEKAATPPIPTGFPSLDRALGDGFDYAGGLEPGLYTVGAISSLGKTTFVMQMADYIASTGRDVLLFAMEMSANQLMGKSISRITTETAKHDGERKTVQGIMEGRRWERYSEGDRRAIEAATKLYETISQNLYILEGVGNISAVQVRESVIKHKAITGKAPIVVVDYLQILAPLDPRATDKMNTDAAVLELKRISRDYDIPIICISSFNRTNYKEKVSMEALKESGAIEYSSDVVIGLQLKGVGDKNFDVDKAKKEIPRKIEAVILKNRSARTGDVVDFEYDPRFNVFVDVRNGHKYPASDDPQRMRL